MPYGNFSWPYFHGVWLDTCTNLAGFIPMLNWNDTPGEDPHVHNCTDKAPAAVVTAHAWCRLLGYEKAIRVVKASVTVECQLPYSGSECFGYCVGGYYNDDFDEERCMGYADLISITTYEQLVCYTRKGV